MRVPADHSFPYIKKRLLVYYRRQEELTPIEVAIDVMTSKVSELHEVVSQSHTDVKKLQLKLQGSISVQVGDTSDPCQVEVTHHLVVTYHTAIDSVMSVMCRQLVPCPTVVQLVISMISIKILTLRPIHLMHCGHSSCV